MQMRVGGRFSLTALVILASELFSLVLSAVRSPKHCLHYQSDQTGFTLSSERNNEPGGERAPQDMWL